MCGRDLLDCDLVSQFLEWTYARKLWENEDCILYKFPLRLCLSVCCDGLNMSARIHTTLYIMVLAVCLHCGVSQCILFPHDTVHFISIS